MYLPLLHILGYVLYITTLLFSRYLLYVTWWTYKNVQNNDQSIPCWINIPESRSKRFWVCRLFSDTIDSQDMARYWTQYERTKTKTLFRLRTHIRLPKVCPHGWAMRRLFWVLWGKDITRYREYIVFAVIICMFQMSSYIRFISPSLLYTASLNVYIVLSSSLCLW